MEEFIEHVEKLKPNGNTWMVYLKEETEKLGLKVHDHIGLVLCRPEDRDNIHSLLYGSDPYLYYVSVGIDGDRVFYEIRKALSERNLAHSLDYEPVIILGPFAKLLECRSFRDLLEERQEKDSGVLKGLFDGFVNV